MTVSTTAIPALRDNYIWLLQGASDHVVVIDPGEADPVLQWLEKNQLTLSAILVTHHHHDHTGGIATLGKCGNIPVFGPAADSIKGVTHALTANETVELPEIGCTFRALATPGHTRGQANYYGEGMVFTGDTLFSAGCGRLFEGSADQMWTSLCQLRELPAETRVFCGHEYTEANLRFAAQVEPDNEAIKIQRAWAEKRRMAGQPTLPTTIGAEREFNPFLRADHDNVRASAEAHTGMTLNNSVAVFAALRTWKDTF